MSLLGIARRSLISRFPRVSGDEPIAQKGTPLVP